MENLFRSQDAREGLTAFSEKRTPNSPGAEMSTTGSAVLERGVFIGGEPQPIAGRDA